jgi:hypothetical protein
VSGGAKAVRLELFLIGRFFSSCGYVWDDVAPAWQMFHVERQRFKIGRPSLLLLGSSPIWSVFGKRPSVGFGAGTEGGPKQPRWSASALRQYERVRILILVTVSRILVLISLEARRALIPGIRTWCMMLHTVAWCAAAE